MQIKNRIKGLAQLHHSKIQPCPKNWRTHGDRQRDVLRGLLADVGVVDAVLVRPLGEKGLRALRQVKRGDAAGFAKWLTTFEGAFMLVDGHLRVEELQQHGDGTIDVLVLDLDEREAAEVLALFDPIGDLAGMDRALFQANLGDFNSTNAAVMAMCADLAQVEQRMREEAEGATGGGVDPAAGRPSLDDLENEFGTEHADELFWPEIKVKAPPDLFERWGEALGRFQGKPYERVAMLLDAAEREV